MLTAVLSGMEEEDALCCEGIVDGWGNVEEGGCVNEDVDGEGPYETGAAAPGQEEDDEGSYEDVAAVAEEEGPY